jgi:hypothetical protein
MMTEGWDEIRIIHDDEWGVSRPWSKYLLDETIKRLSKIEHENPYHQFSIGQHCLATWMYLRNHYPDADVTLQRATILHDIGKEKTKVFIDSKGNPTDVAHYYQHERVGAYDSFFYTRDLSHDQRLNVSLLIRWHMMPYVINRSDNPSKTTAKAKRLLGDDIWNQVMVLNDCDRNAH